MPEVSEFDAAYDMASAEEEEEIGATVGGSLRAVLVSRKRRRFAGCTSEWLRD